MSGQELFPRVSWGLCLNRIKATGVLGTPWCDMPASGPLYAGLCGECRWIFDPAGEARTWASPATWEAIEAGPEPFPRAGLRIAWERMERLAKGNPEKLNDECRAIAAEARDLIAAYGAKHYPKKGEDDGA